MAEHKKILLIVPGGLSYLYRVGNGISSKVGQHESWLVHVTPLAQAGFMKEFDADGIIMNISTPISLEFAESLNTSVVNYSGVMDVRSIPTVRLDDVEIGKMAADYLLSLGLKNFAFFGELSTSFAALRYTGFAEKLHNSGISQRNISRLDAEENHLFHSKYDDYGKWLKSLPKPIGIFTKSDRCGCYLSNVARESGIAVPDEVAILSVDNDPMYCGLAKPALSSIATPSHQVGRVAVDLLAAILAGKPVPAEPVLLPPLGVVARGSTDMLAIEDDDLADAIRFIRSNPGGNVCVEDVLKVVPISRSSLERKFQEFFGCSPGQEIARMKISQVKKLLLNTDKSITEIAAYCDYCDVPYLSSSFRKQTGMTPSAFRAELKRDRF